MIHRLLIIPELIMPVSLRFFFLVFNGMILVAGRYAINHCVPIRHLICGLGWLTANKCNVRAFVRSCVRRRMYQEQSGAIIVCSIGEWALSVDEQRRQSLVPWLPQFRTNISFFNAALFGTIVYAIYGMHTASRIREDCWAVFSSVTHPSVANTLRFCYSSAV